MKYNRRVSHFRNRAIEFELKKMLTYSPCVGVLGMRQVGKTTLLKRLAEQYHSFDDEEFLRKFETAAKTYLEQKNVTVALDEIQKYPPAFDVLKFSVDSFKKPGRFIISGSVRFSSRRQIRESLTGRIVLAEVFPMTLAECHSQNPSLFVKLVLSKSDSSLIASLERRAWATESQLVHYLKTGGLPGICFRREESIRWQMFNNHLDTLLGRDIHLIVDTKLTVVKLKAILFALAREQGLPVSYTKLARIASVSVPTIQNMLAAMQGLFLIRPYGKTYYLEDAGLSHSLCPVSDQWHRLDMVRSLYYELRTQHGRKTAHHSLEPFTTRGGIDVPISLVMNDGLRVAIGVDDDEHPSDKSIKSLVWYRKRFSRARLIMLTRGRKAQMLASGVICLPWTWVF